MPATIINNMALPSWTGAEPPTSIDSIRTPANPQAILVIDEEKKEKKEKEEEEKKRKKCSSLILDPRG